MTDYQGAKYGAVEFPLPAQGSGIGGAGATLLQDADPALFYLLEFYAACIKHHIGSRLLSEVASVGADDVITSAVADTAPVNPEDFLVDTHFRFPLLCAYRKESKFENIGQHKNSIGEVEVAYVLPPLGPGEAERLLPILRAVAMLLDNRTELGMEPSYTPTGAVRGYPVWGLTGITKIEVKSVEYGGYAPTEKLFFPSVVLKLEITEESDLVVNEFEIMEAADVNIDVADPFTDTTVSDVVQIDVDTTQ
jgi:hypothetical protein